MLKYSEWLIGEGKTKTYNLYVIGPSVTPIAEKLEKLVKGIVADPKSYMTIKFRGTSKELSKAERALEEAGFRVVDSEVSHD
jgi:hypothetical protein